MQRNLLYFLINVKLSVIGTYFKFPRFLLILFNNIWQVSIHSVKIWALRKDSASVLETKSLLTSSANTGERWSFLFLIGAVLFAVRQQEHISENNNSKTNQLKRSKNYEKIDIGMFISLDMNFLKIGPCCFKHIVIKMWF